MKRTRNWIQMALLLFVPALVLPTCETNRGELIPYVRVDLYLFLYADLADLGVGGTKLVSGGVNGLVLYRESDLVYHAYDRTCTLFPEHDEAVVEDSTFFGVFECPECSSTYLLMNGGEPNSGPARYPLVQYKTSIQGDVLHIYN